MRTKCVIGMVAMLGILAAGISYFLAVSAFAHCDTTRGPVILEAKAALEKGDVTPVLKWVKKDNEAEIKRAFAKAVTVRAKGPEAKELADQFLLETLVRLHRTGEGAAYTGLKDDPVEPVVAMADKALADGSADEMIKRISGHMAEAIWERFNKAMDAKTNKDKSVEAGREYVGAYVTYMHYVEAIHAAIISAGTHHAEAEKSTPAHKD